MFKMGSAMHMQSYCQREAAPTAAAAAPNLFGDDEASILDDMLEQQTMSPSSRRASFAVSAAMFSPKNDDWPQSVEMQSVPSTNSFDVQHRNNPFVQAPPTVLQAWPMTGPMPQVFRGIQGGEPDGFALRQQHQRQVPPTPLPAPEPVFRPVPTSPAPDGWLVHDLQTRMTAKPPAANPMMRTLSEMRRAGADGFRKKNARFDIPAERNLHNIDAMIAQCTDEDKIKELKQQKRLLRNRQAALDSRQRKKMHTERLEDEKKQFTEMMAAMQADLDKLKQDLAQTQLQKQGMAAYIEQMERDREEMVTSHTVETGELRKKIGVLSSHVQALEIAAAQPMPPSHTFAPTAYADVDDLAMPAGSPWDSVGVHLPMLVADYGLHGEPPAGMEMDIKHETLPHQQSILPTVMATKDSAASAALERPVQQGGLLTMLFLVGALVLSSRNASPPRIPRVSEDVRAASATLLETVFKDAGVATTPSRHVIMPTATGSAGWLTLPSSASASSLAAPPPGIDGLVGREDAVSMLATLSDTLTQPTAQQSTDQLFGLTPAQYDHVTCSAQQQPQQSPPATSPAANTRQHGGRRNLAEALASMHAEGKQSSVAEVYTRSLLWDTIPSDVVRQFARMMCETAGEDDGDSEDEDAHQRRELLTGATALSVS